MSLINLSFSLDSSIHKTSRQWHPLHLLLCLTLASFLSVFADVAVAASKNVALTSEGSNAYANSPPQPGFPLSAVTDGDRKGVNWRNGGGWVDSTANYGRDEITIKLPSPQKIDRVVVYTIQDDWANPVEPTDDMAQTHKGTAVFDVSTSINLQTVPLAEVRNNNLVKRTVYFPPVTTDNIRFGFITQYGFTKIVELEVWTAEDKFTTDPNNVAGNSSGGVVTVSSTVSPTNHPATSINDGDRKEARWGKGGGWNDGTINSWPDSVQVKFNGTKKIDRVVVYTLQDNYGSPVEPTDAMTFTQYGITDFDVQTWNGSSWVTVGSVMGNNLVKRTVSFPATSTDRVQIVVNKSLNSYSRITEVEAFQAP